MSRARNGYLYGIMWVLISIVVAAVAHDAVGDLCATSFQIQGANARLMMLSGGVIGAALTLFVGSAAWRDHIGMWNAACVVRTRGYLIFTGVAFLLYVFAVTWLDVAFVPKPAYATALTF